MNNPMTLLKYDHTANMDINAFLTNVCSKYISKNSEYFLYSKALNCIVTTLLANITFKLRTYKYEFYNMKSNMNSQSNSNSYGFMNTNAYECAMPKELMNLNESISMCQQEMSTLLECIQKPDSHSCPSIFGKNNNSSFSMSRGGYMYSNNGVLTDGEVSNTLGYLQQREICNLYSLTYCGVNTNSMSSCPHQPCNTVPFSARRIVDRMTAEEYKLLWCIDGHCLNPAYCVIFDKTGQYLISGADDFLVKVWHVPTARLCMTLRGHQSYISMLALSSDNALIASACTHGMIRIWLFNTGKCVAVLNHGPGCVHWIKFEDNSMKLVTGGDNGECIVWDIAQYLVSSSSAWDHTAPISKNLPLGNVVEDITAVTTAVDESGRDLYFQYTAGDVPLLDVIGKRLSTMSVSDPENLAKNGKMKNGTIYDLPPLYENIATQFPWDTTPKGPDNPEGNVETDIESPMHLNLPHIRQIASHQRHDHHSGNGAAQTDGTAEELVPVFCLDICPLGNYVVTGGEDGVARVWCIDRHTHEMCMEGRANARSTDGLECNSAFQSPCHTPPRATRQNVASHGTKSNSLRDTMSNLKKLKGKISDKEYKQLNSIAKHLVKKLSFDGTSGPSPGSCSAVTDVKFSNNGDRVVTGWSAEGLMRIWTFNRSFNKYEYISIQLHDNTMSTSDPTHSTTFVADNSPNLRSSPGNTILYQSRRMNKNKTSEDSTAMLLKKKSQLYNVNWTCDDRYIVTLESAGAIVAMAKNLNKNKDGKYGATPTATAVNSVSTEGGACMHDEGSQFKVFNSNSGQLLKQVWFSFARTDVLAVHPKDPNMLCTAGMDGVLRVWDIRRIAEVSSEVPQLTDNVEHLTVPQKPLYEYVRRCPAGVGTIPENTPIRVVDVIYSPDCTHIACTDFIGRISLFGMKMQDSASYHCALYTEQYFSNDYSDLVLDENSWAIDVQTQLPVDRVMSNRYLCRLDGSAYSTQPSDLGSAPGTRSDAARIVIDLDEEDSNEVQITDLTNTASATMSSLPPIPPAPTPLSVEAVYDQMEETGYYLERSRTQMDQAYSSFSRANRNKKHDCQAKGVYTVEQLLHTAMGTLSRLDAVGVPKKDARVKQRYNLAELYNTGGFSQLTRNTGVHSPDNSNSPNYTGSNRNRVSYNVDDAYDYLSDTDESELGSDFGGPSRSSRATRRRTSRVRISTHPPSSPSRSSRRLAQHSARRVYDEEDEESEIEEEEFYGSDTSSESEQNDESGPEDSSVRRRSKPTKSKSQHRSHGVTSNSSSKNQRNKKESIPIPLKLQKWSKLSQVDDFFLVNSGDDPFISNGSRNGTVPIGIPIDRQWCLSDVSTDISSASNILQNMKSVPPPPLQYCPQVGDHVCYLPQGHFELLNVFRHDGESSNPPLPWKSIAQFDSHRWPVVECRVLDVTYYFPSEFEHKYISESVITYIKLQIIGLPVSIQSSAHVLPSRSSNQLSSPGHRNPYFISEFAAPRHTRSGNNTNNMIFYIPMRSCGLTDFIIPYHVYMESVRIPWAIGMKVAGQFREYQEVVANENEDEVEENKLKRMVVQTYTGSIVDISDSGVGDDHEFNISSVNTPSTNRRRGHGRGNSSHGSGSGNNAKWVNSPWDCISIQWDDGTEDSSRICPWEITPLHPTNSTIEPGSTLCKQNGLSKECEEHMLAYIESCMGLDSNKESQLFDLEAEKELEDPGVATTPYSLFCYDVDTNLFPDYPSVVPVPMTLELIRRRLENKYYHQVDSLKADARLIYKNCKLYNIVGAPIIETAKQLMDSIYRELERFDSSGSENSSLIVNATTFSSSSSSGDNRNHSMVESGSHVVVPSRRVGLRNSRNGQNAPLPTQTHVSIIAEESRETNNANTPQNVKKRERSPPRRSTRSSRGAPAISETESNSDSESESDFEEERVVSHYPKRKKIGSETDSNVIGTRTSARITRNSASHGNIESKTRSSLSTTARTTRSRNRVSYREQESSQDEDEVSN